MWLLLGFDLARPYLFIFLIIIVVFPWRASVAASPVVN